MKFSKELRRTPPEAARKVCSATAKCGSMRWATFQAMAFSTSKSRDSSLESSSGGDMRNWFTSNTWAFTSMRLSDAPGLMTL